MKNLRDFCKTSPFAGLLRHAQIAILEILNIFLRLKFSPSLYSNKIESFETVSLQTSRNFLFAILLPALSLMIFYGCAPKTYVSSYADPKFDFDEIKTVVVVPQNSRTNDLLFAEIFTQTAIERKKFFLARKDYVLKKELSKSELSTETDAFLEIAVTHAYLGNRTRFFPTSIGAYAKLVEPETNKMLWNMNYTYSSAETGPSAPAIEKVMKIVARMIINDVPLKYTVPVLTVTEEPEDIAPEIVTEEPEDIAPEVVTKEPEDIAPEVVLEQPAPVEKKFTIVEYVIPFKTIPYLIHTASVRVQRSDSAEKFINKKTDDGTIRLATLVDLGSKGLWYRLMIGRFKSLDASQSYLENLEQSYDIDKYARPVNLPFSLLISSEQGLTPSQKIIDALKRKRFLATLFPSAGEAETYDIILGAYESEEEAALEERKVRDILNSSAP